VAMGIEHFLAAAGRASVLGSDRPDGEKQAHRDVVKSESFILPSTWDPGAAARLGRRSAA
jgi:hypothetical protein